MEAIIRHLSGENKQFVFNVISHKEKYYGKFNKSNSIISQLIHANFFELVDGQNNLLGFFCLYYWEFEICIGFVYIKRKYRKQGLLHLIIEYSKQQIKKEYKESHKTKWLTINAEPANKKAIKIYNKLFTFENNLSKKAKTLWWYWNYNEKDLI